MDDGIECRYDSAVGLSEAYRNHVGALMGCVCSPDRCKILLNSLVVAIAPTHPTSAGLNEFGV